MVYTRASACVRSLAHFEYHQPTFTNLSYWKCFQLVLCKYIYNVRDVRVCVTIKRLLDDTNQSFSHVDVPISIYYMYIQIQYLRRRFGLFSIRSHPIQWNGINANNDHEKYSLRFSLCFFRCLECKKNEMAYHMQNGTK